MMSMADAPPRPKNISAGHKLRHVLFQGLWSLLNYTRLDRASLS